MQQCVYCPTEFDEAPKEHVIQVFLGTRWKDGKLICETCQTAFANGIDKALAERLQPYRLLLGIEGDHGGTGQPLKNLPVTSGETIDLGPRGQPRIVRSVVNVTEEGGRHQVQVKIGREKDLDWALSEVRKQLPHAKLDREQIKKLGVPKKERLDGEVKLDLNLGGADFFRAVLKCCANLFAAHENTARAAFLGPAFDEVRAFIRDGVGQMGDFARWITSDAPLDLPKQGPADQTIVLTTRDSSVEGVVRFFGHLPLAVRLTTSYPGPPVRCAYVVDPYREVTPAEQRLTGDDLAQYDERIPVFTEQFPGNNALVQASWDAGLNRFLAHYTERENEETVQKVVKETIRQDPRAAAMARERLVEMVRGLVRKRFERFEQTGDASGITVIKTRSINAASPPGDDAG
jgi:hypothetical protein